jgi:HlyD family secretion protein
MVKRSTTLILILLIAPLVIGAGYLGVHSTGADGKLDLGAGWDALLGAVGLKERQVQARAEPQAPATVPVTRGNVQQTVIAPGRLVDTRETSLGVDVGGRLAEIYARPGSVVREGNVLAQLDTGPLEAALQEAHLKLEQARAAYARQLVEAELAVETARLRLSQAQADHPRKLAEAELRVQTAESGLAQARLQSPTLTAANIRLQNAIEAEVDAEKEYQEALERQKNNWEPEEVAKSYLRALEAAQDARAIAEADYNAVRGKQVASGMALDDQEANIEQAKIALERLQAGVDPTLALDLEKAQKALNDLRETGVDPFLELALKKAQADLDAATLSAPFDGTVLDVQAKAGQTVAPGAELLVLVDPTAVEVQSTVIEEELPLVQVGQLVELFFDAMPELAVQGRVERIVPRRVQGENRPLYHVYITPDAPLEGLLSGMTVDASIIIAQRTDVLRLPRALLRADSDGIAQVEVWQNGQVQKRTVKVGLRGDVNAEILSGLQEGELVVGQ